jgi:hypothetical protein
VSYYLRGLLGAAACSLFLLGDLSLSLDLLPKSLPEFRPPQEFDLQSDAEHKPDNLYQGLANLENWPGAFRMRSSFAISRAEASKHIDKPETSCHRKAIRKLPRLLGSHTIAKVRRMLRERLCSRRRLSFVSKIRSP